MDKIISVVSYESAAGRTMMAAGLFAWLAARGDQAAQLMGYDVDKPDLLTIFNHVKFEASEVYAGFPRVDKLRCKYCGACVRFCDCGALHIDRNIPSVIINPEKCEACGNCLDGCQLHGIHLKERLTGYILHGRMNGHLLTVGKAEDHEDFLLPLICNLHQKRRNDRVVISDLGPGFSEFVKTSLRGTDMAVVIQRPARGWTRNIRFLTDWLKEQQIPAGIVINKYRGEEGFLEEVKQYCRKEKIAMLAVVPFFGQERFAENNFLSFLSDPEIESIFAALWGRIWELEPVSTAPKKK